ncbi:FkbM family methyltransferase [Conexivisphaera calida]|uniref:Methyltransferase, FkbM family domain protein n=1 Tax=Conexivisphaera calida TaxID=1874277 RepID=A0A4P2VPE8_9ARCH|nr:FkbM family methyltransferase [Conexivisphaera calida]BBE42788.1 methyltransferase, FkbM family domain protein [Conexivisphaera calida]
MGYLEVIRRYRKAYRNWIGVLAAEMLGRETVRVVLRNGASGEVSAGGAYHISMLISHGFDVIDININTYEIIFGYNGIKVKLYGFVYGDPHDAFKYYKWLDVRGKKVLDVGASIGDTAIYFSLRGSKEVVAFEPYPFPYSYAKRNLEANNISNIVLVNAAVGGSDGVVTLTTGQTNSGTPLRPSPDGVQVPVYSLDTIIEKYGPFDVMKMDCEGCEYDAILNSRRIGEIRQIQIEYHYGPKRLVDKLRETAFSVRHAGSRGLGYIYAER